MTAIHQFVPTLAPRDAVGGHYMRMRATLRDAGYTSDIYAMEAKDELAREMPPRPHNAREYILADGCRPWFRIPGPAARTEHYTYPRFKAALRASHW